MIAIRLVLDAEGLPCLCEAQGHARRSADGLSLSCAAATVLMRSFADCVSACRPRAVSIEAPVEGSLRIAMRTELFDQSWLRGAGDVLLAGLSRLAREASDEVALTIE